MSVKHFVDARGDSRYEKTKYSGDYNDPLVPIVSVEGNPYSIAFGDFEEYTAINKFGARSNVDILNLPAVIWDGPTSNYVPPTQARIHQVSSTSSEDTGAIVSTGTLTSDGVIQVGGTYVVDNTNADFITDGVIPGDIIIFTDHSDHSVVTEVLSATSLHILPPHHGSVAPTGSTYEIVQTTGTGCGIVHLVSGLDENMQVQKEFVVMNGTTPVSTVKSYVRINRTHSDGSGSNKANVGTISFVADVDGTTTAVIAPGNNQTLMAHFTLPAGYKGALTNFYISLNKNKSPQGAMATFGLFIDKFAPMNPIGPVPLNFINAAVDGSSDIARVFDPPITIEERTDVYIICTDSSHDNLVINAGFDLVLDKHRAT